MDDHIYLAVADLEFGMIRVWCSDGCITYESHVFDCAHPVFFFIITRFDTISIVDPPSPPHVCGEGLSPRHVEFLQAGLGAIVK